MFEMGNRPQIGSLLITHNSHSYKLTLTGPVDTMKQKNRADETEPSADPNFHHLYR